MSQSLVAEDEDVRQSCFTKSAEEPGCLGPVCARGVGKTPRRERFLRVIAWWNLTQQPSISFSSILVTVLLTLVRWLLCVNGIFTVYNDRENGVSS